MLQMKQGFGLGIHSKLGIKGKAHLRLFGPDGELKEERIIHNTLTELMDAQVAD